MSEDDEDDRVNILIPRIDKDEKKQFKENVDEMAGTLRDVISTYNEVKEDYDLDDELKSVNITILRTYLTAIEKNIQTLEAQKSQIESKLEEFENDEEEDEVVVEIDLDVATKNL